VEEWKIALELINQRKHIDEKKALQHGVVDELVDG